MKLFHKILAQYELVSYICIVNDNENDSRNKQRNEFKNKNKE